MQPTPLKSSTNLVRLEKALEYTFARKELLVHALTHRSQAYEQAMEAEPAGAQPERSDNERLEFLGDAVLGLVVAEALYQRNQDWQEGEMTRMRAQLVSRRHMAEVALAVGLGAYLRLGKGEDRSGGRRKVAILANAMEAVIAAMYLDAGRDLAAEGNLEPVRRFARKHILGTAADDLARELVSGASLGDHKSALQEFLQATHAGVPVYRVESESGPDHRKRFQVQVRLKAADGQTGDPLANGTATTEKKAEQEAARRALAVLTALTEPLSRQPAESAREEVEEPAQV